MPLYEFICDKCGYKFEKLVNSMSNRTKQICPECNSEAKKTVSSFTAHSNPGTGPCGKKENSCSTAHDHGGCGGCCPFSG
ncbi:MAG: zinc ribbon domain-containing protein [Phycisphaerae bacterium]|nr:zinc ribbon domain-containing protein [Phycisphaerae bacterium]